jgi:hypothetical protein
VDRVTGSNVDLRHDLAWLTATPGHIDGSETACFNGRFVSGNRMDANQLELFRLVSNALANRQGAKRAAETLNKNNIPSATGRPWTRRMVYGVCKSLGIPNPYYSSEEIARWRKPHRGVSSVSIYEQNNERL